MKMLYTSILLLLLISCTDNDSADSSGSSDVAGTNSAPKQPTAQPSINTDSIQLIEQVTAGGDEIVIPYSKYKLENGMTLILHEDKSDPLVHVNITYHVGSAREETQRSGFAHFFEHMMFQGSAHVGDDEHFAIVTEAGGTMNGSTSNDRTNYYQTVPSNQLETTLWLESDRMGFLLEAVTQEKFEIQRSTVKNERGQNVENRPYGRSFEINSSALYPAGHPYSWPVIGYPEDLDSATLEDLKSFFLRWYGPNNAILVVAGNIETEKTLQLVQKYFGSIPPGPTVERDHREPVTLDQDRYVSYVDKNIRFPALMINYPTVAYSDPDRVALSGLANILGGGKKSELYKRFVLTQKAIQVQASNRSLELAGSFSFVILPFPGTPLDEFEEELREVLNNFSTDSISDDDLQIFKASTESSLINGLASVAGKASRIASYEYLLENPDNIRNELTLVRNLTKDDILRVFNQYIRGKNAVIQSVLPSNMEDGQTSPDNYDIPSPLPVALSDTDDLEPRAVIDDLDRSTQPGAGPAPLVSVPEHWRETLENGVAAIGSSTSELPTVTLRLEFSGGHMLDALEHYGISSLTALMMNEGTNSFSAEQFEIELQKLGSSISLFSGSESTVINVRTLKDNLDETLSLLQQRLFESKFTEEDLARLKQQQIESLQAAKEQPSAIASNVYRRLLYGEEHKLSVANDGEIETLESITLQDIEAFSKANIVADSLRLVIVGDISQQEIVSKLGFLTELPQQALVVEEQPAVPTFSETTLYLVDKPGAAQSEIRIGYVTDLAYDVTGPYFKRYLMNYILGGAFNSRINLNLREDKGYTYGARSNFSGTKRPGPFTASASVKTDTTADSVQQFINEISAYWESGITENELAFTRSAIGQRDALNYETPRQKSGFLGRILRYDLDSNFVERQTEIINTITQDELNQLANQYLPLENMLILVVGDKEVIEDSLVELGFPIVELDTSGRTLDDAE